MRVKCPDCGKVRETVRTDPRTWPCSCTAAPTSTQTFTVDPYAIRTQFAPATRPTYRKETS